METQTSPTQSQISALYDDPVQDQEVRPDSSRSRSLALGSRLQALLLTFLMLSSGAEAEYLAQPSPGTDNYSDYEAGAGPDYESNSSYWNETRSRDPFSVPFQVVIYIIYNAVLVAALLGNTLVCYVVFSSPRMRTVTNYLIANLAVGDLLMALLCVPFSYISLLLQYWPFGAVLCHVVAPAQAVCVFVSAYTLVALAGDRYVAILYPLKPRLRRSQAIIVICIVWVIAILTSLPIAIVTKLVNSGDGYPECQEIWPDQQQYKLVYSLTLMILQYFFPLAVLVFTYTRIALAVWGKKAPGEAEDGRDQRLAKAKRKMIKMMLTVVVVYTVSWLPFNVLVVYGDLDRSIWAWEHMNYAFPIIQWLALSHTVCNPIIYCWMNSRFRAGFRSAIANVPVLKRLSLVGGRAQDFQLHRINTCSTYTFASGHGKLGRNSSLISNGRTTVLSGGSPAPVLRNFSDASRRLNGLNPARTARLTHNILMNSPGSARYSPPSPPEVGTRPSSYPTQGLAGGPGNMGPRKNSIRVAGGGIRPNGNNGQRSE